MKDNFIHVCFVIDESGSMWGTESDVIGGFKKVIDEQKEIKEGTCAVSYFKFSTGVEEVFLGKDINEVEYLDGKYSPHGLTALFDGVGQAIDKVGKWLNDMKEEDRPEKNLIVIMTDGGENNSRDYDAAKVKEMIKHQEEKYNWSFVYMGSDLKDADDANTLGFKTRSFTAKGDYIKNYDMISCSMASYRCTDGNLDAKTRAFANTLNEATIEATKKYAKENGLEVTGLLDVDNNEPFFKKD